MKMPCIKRCFSQQGLPLVSLPLFFLYAFGRSHSEERNRDRQAGYFHYGLVLMHHIVLKGSMRLDAGVISSVSQSSFCNLYMRNDKTRPLEALWDTCDRR